MKKLIALILTVLTVFAIGCGKSDKYAGNIEDYMYVVNISAEEKIGLCVDGTNKVTAIQYLSQNSKKCISPIADDIIGKEIKAAVNKALEVMFTADSTVVEFTNNVSEDFDMTKTAKDTFGAVSHYGNIKFTVDGNEQDFN